MKTFIKLFVAAFLVLSTSCLEILVGSAVVAGGTYIATQGYVETHVDRNYNSSWQQMELYASTNGEITYHSQNEGIIKLDFKEGGSGTFKIKKTTERATLVSLRCSKYGFPSNSLAETHFTAMMQMMR